MTADGRIYYIDHNTRRTTWEKPRYVERQPTAEERGANVGPTEQVMSKIPPTYMYMYTSMQKFLLHS